MIWRLWPHFKRIWAGAGAIAIWSAVNYLYGLMGNQSVPDLQCFLRLLLSYRSVVGAGLISFAGASVIASGRIGGIQGRSLSAKTVRQRVRSSRRYRQQRRPPQI